MVDTLFTDYTFEADIGSYAGTDTRVARTLPERITEVLNVKDWGAAGDGSTDDTAAINAVIDYAYFIGNALLPGVTIFFPPGIYLIGSPPLSLERSTTRGAAIVIEGSGPGKTILRGFYEQPGEPYNSLTNGFLFQTGFEGNPFTLIRDIMFENQSVDPYGGCFICMGGGTMNFYNCHFRGNVGFVYQMNNFGLSMSECLFTCTKPVTAANAAARSPLFDFANFVDSTAFTGSVGAYIGGGLISNCKAVGFDIGFSFLGNQGAFWCCTAVQCSVGLSMGVRAGVIQTSSGVVLDGGNNPGQWFLLHSSAIRSCVFDRCTWGIHINGGNSLSVASNLITGSTGPFTPATISNLTWNSGTHVVTVDTVADHNIVTASTVQITPANWTSDSDGFVTATVGGNTKQFTYPGPGSVPSFTSATWNYPIEYGITIAGSDGCTYAANVLDAACSIASFDMQQLAKGGGGEYAHSIGMAMRGPYGWRPSQVYNDMGWRFVSCGTTGALARSGTLGAPGPFLTQLRTDIAEGDEHTVVNAQTQTNFGGFLATWVPLDADWSSGTTATFSFAIPAGVVVGTTIIGTKLGGGTTVSSIAGGRLSITTSNAPFGTMFAGEQMFFGLGGSNHYKIRFDGTSWVRVG